MPRAVRGSPQGDFFAPTSWQSLVAACAQIARDLGLDVETEVYVGRRIWGARRRIDIVVTDRTLRRSLGIEVKYQRTAGSAEEKIPATIDDIAVWPIPGIVVFYGPGFSGHMRSFLQAAGKAVELEDLETWLRLYFVLGSARPSLTGEASADATGDAEPSSRRSTSAG